MADNVIKRLVDAGVEFTGVSQSKAEALVRKLVRDGELRRKDAETAVATLVGKGKDTETIVVSCARSARQLEKPATRADDVEHRVEEVLSTLMACPGGAGGSGPAAR